MSDFGTPGSPNAAALQNILGAGNTLRVPQSENEMLLQLIAQQTQTLINTLNDVKDIVDILSSIQRYIGVTTTELSDGVTTNPILIDEESVTAVSGDAVIYNGEDFVFNGEIWQSVPDALGALAYKSSASGSYTPQGTVSNPELVAVRQRTDLSVIGTVGQLPSLTYDGTTETLTFNPGSLPTKGTHTLTYITNVALGEPPVFIGTAATITVE